jgi:hypothetical protein
VVIPVWTNDSVPSICESSRYTYKYPGTTRKEKLDPTSQFQKGTTLYAAVNLAKKNAAPVTMIKKDVASSSMKQPVVEASRGCK